jgi:hypothetical protein
VHILGGFEEGVGFAAAAGLDGDAVVAGRDVAAIDKDMPAGIDIDAVGIAAGAPDGRRRNRGRSG